MVSWKTEEDTYRNHRLGVGAKVPTETGSEGRNMGIHADTLVRLVVGQK